MVTETGKLRSKIFHDLRMMDCEDLLLVEYAISDLERLGRLLRATPVLKGRRGKTGTANKL